LAVYFSVEINIREMRRSVNVSRLALLAAALSLAGRCTWSFVASEPQQTGLAARRRTSSAGHGSRVARAAGGPLDSLPALPSWVPVPSMPTLPTISQPVWDDAAKTLLETVIAWGVPALAIGLVGGAIAAGIGSKLARDAARDRRLRRSPIRGGKGAGGGVMSFLSGGGGEEDIGGPQEYLKVERINDRYESFAYSLQKATGAPAAAIAGARRRELERRFGEEIGMLNDSQLADFVRLEGEYREAAMAAAEEVEDASRELRLFAVEGGGPMSPMEQDKEDGDAPKEEKKEMPMMRMFRGKELDKKLAAAIKKSVTTEALYLQQVSKALGGKEASEERLGLARLVTDRPYVWDPRVSPLELPVRAAAGDQKMERAAAGEEGDVEHAKPSGVVKRAPTWFVLEFFGDVQASQVAQLRQEVTAVIEAANPANGDGVVLILNSGGGTVTGYGLAAAQLLRIKAAGLPLTISVEQVAASGGYMMACCADKLVSGPFAVLGSIGVITEIPNVFERLQKEGIQFESITAGKFKRTLTPTKKVTEEDKLKTKEDIEAIFKLFRSFVKENRPQLDIDAVATGETWFGQDAKDRKLVDELISSDDIMVNLCKGGAELYSVKYQPVPTSPLGALLGASSEHTESLVSSSGAAGNGGGGLSWWAKRLFEFAMGTPAGAMDSLKQSAFSSRPDQAYRAEDNSSQFFR